MNYNMKYLQTFENYTEYVFDKSLLNDLIKNARKYSEKDFIEEYVYLNDISLKDIHAIIKENDKIDLYRMVRNDKGKLVYINGIQSYTFYKTVIADKYYGTKHWEFIMDNTKELQEEAKEIYKINKANKKPKINKKEKTIIAYHASPYKFDIFRYGANKTSGQIGAENGFFFFKDIKYAKYYASIIKENHGSCYIYTCKIKIGNVITEKGENVGTNWNRVGFLESMNNEGYDTVIIEDADTGYGITDEIIVFDDDNIEIIDTISN